MDFEWSRCSHSFPQTRVMVSWRGLLKLFITTVTFISSSSSRVSAQFINDSSVGNSRNSLGTSRNPQSQSLPGFPERKSFDPDRNVRSSTTPNLQPAAVYGYEFIGSGQSKFEERDIFGGVHGGYSVEFPGEHGGVLTHSYYNPASTPIFTAVHGSSLGPPGTTISIVPGRRGEIQLVVDRDRRRSSSVGLNSKNQESIAVSVGLVPQPSNFFLNDKQSPSLVEFNQEAALDGFSREQELQLREPGDAVVVENQGRNIKFRSRPIAKQDQRRQSRLTRLRRF